MKTKPKTCDHLGCKNHVTHPCEKCGYQAKEPVTFWLARDKTSVTLHDYNISPSKMTLFKYYGCYFGINVDGLTEENIEILGLPHLRKGQQVQLRRTPQGWEVVR